jgi:hypothetical protein
VPVFWICGQKIDLFRNNKSICRRGFWSACVAFIATLTEPLRADTTAPPSPPIQVRMTPSKVATITFKDVQRETIDQILRDVFSKREHGAEVLHVLQDARAVPDTDQQYRKQTESQRQVAPFARAFSDPALFESNPQFCGVGLWPAPFPSRDRQGVGY